MVCYSFIKDCGKLEHRQVNLAGISRGILAKVLDCALEVCNIMFSLGLISLKKVLNLLILPAIG